MPGTPLSETFREMLVFTSKTRMIGFIFTTLVFQKILYSQACISQGLVLFIGLTPGVGKFDQGSSTSFR